MRQIYSFVEILARGGELSCCQFCRLNEDQVQIQLVYTKSCPVQLVHHHRSIVSHIIEGIVVDLVISKNGRPSCARSRAKISDNDLRFINGKNCQWFDFLWLGLRRYQCNLNQFDA